MPGNLDLALRIRADLGNAVRNLDRLEKEIRQTGGAARRSGRDMRRLATETDRTSRSALTLRNAIGGLGFAFGVREVFRFIGGIRNAGIEFQRTQQRFKFATGSIQAAVRELQFVRQQADRLGLDFRAAEDGYTGLAAAARETNLEGQATREIFLAVAEASAVLGLSTQDARGAMVALEQIISKGKITAEELRQQLGERFPGAINILARALGKSTEEINEMLERGDIFADSLVAWASETRKTFGDDVPDAVNRAEASFIRLENAITRLEENVASNGLNDFLVHATRQATILVNRLNSIQQFFFGQEENREANILRAAGDFVSGRGSSRSAQFDIIRELEQLLEDDRVALSKETARLLRQLVAEGTPRRPGVPLEVPLDLIDRATRITPPAVPEPDPVPDLGQRANVKAFEKAQGDITKILERAQLERIELTRGELAKIEEETRRGLQKLEQLRDDAIEAAGDDTDRRAEAEKLFQDARVALQLAADEQISQLRREAVEDWVQETRDAVDGVQEALEQSRGDLGLASQFDQDVAAATRWRNTLVEQLRAVGLEHSELRVQVEDHFKRMVEAAREQTTALGGVRAALKDYVREAGDGFTQARTAAENAFRGMEDAIVQFSQTGKFEIGSFVDSVIADLARIAARQYITGPLASAFFGALGGGGSGGGGLFSPFLHGGGTAGGTTRNLKPVDPRVFAFAPRYHQGGIAGLRPNEVPTILERGERVIPNGAPVGFGPPVINVYNEGEPVQVTDANFSLDLSGIMTIDLFVDQVSNGGPIRNVLMRAFRTGV